MSCEAAGEQLGLTLERSCADNLIQLVSDRSMWRDIASIGSTIILPINCRNWDIPDVRARHVERHLLSEADIKR